MTKEMEDKWRLAWRRQLQDAQESRMRLDQEFESDEPFALGEFQTNCENAAKLCCSEYTSTIH